MTDVRLEPPRIDLQLLDYGEIVSVGAALNPET